jgi:indole-3-glycerol phosphate synthase
MTILDDIRAHKEQEVAARQAQRQLPEIIAACNDAPPVRRLKDALTSNNTGTLRLIAEVKRRSPTRGDLRPGADAPSLAATYCEAGAAAVSVLTDEHFFSGSDADLTAVRARVPAPVLRKDFTITSYQIYEARAIGADAILLIVSMLTDELLETFLDTADCLGMDALVEVHSADEAQRATRLRAPIVGINNRDLATFTVDLGTTERIRPLLPETATVVAESGILTRADVERVQAAGATAVLVGEALVTADDPAAKVRELLGRQPAPVAGSSAAPVAQSGA